MKDKDRTKKRMPVWSKILIVIGGLAVFSIIFFFVIDTPAVGYYKQFMWQKMNVLLNDPDATGEKTAEYRVVNDIEFEELEKKVSFKVPQPTWLPEGFEMDYIDYSYNADNYTIDYRYINKDDEENSISVYINTNATENLEKGMMVDYEKVKVGDLEVILLNFDDSFWQTIYINEQGFQITICTFEDRETLFKIIQNMS
jgi:hypothetical protein